MNISTTKYIILNFIGKNMNAGKYYWKGNEQFFVAIFRTEDPSEHETKNFKIHGPFDDFIKAKVNAVNYYRQAIRELHLVIFGISEIEEINIR